MINTEATQENHTLYIKNLNDKVKKEGSGLFYWPIELKISLFFLFSQYGQILDIVTKKAESMRGQAFIVFQNIKSAQRAKQDLEGYNIFDKEMVSHFLLTDLTLTIGNWIRRKKIGCDLDNGRVLRLQGPEANLRKMPTGENATIGPGKG